MHSMKMESFSLLKLVRNTATVMLWAYVVTTVINMYSCQCDEGV